MNRAISQDVVLYFDLDGYDERRRRDGELVAEKSLYVDSS